MIKFVECVDQTNYEDSNLDTFQQITSINEPSKELVTMELLIFKHHQVDSKDIKYHFQWWGKHETMFPIVGFLAHKILGIIGS